MLLGVDLHIHSCLSPCAHKEMTPNNIAAMAALKGLAAIAVCDHNACLNSLACIRAGGRRGLIVVPGVEVTTTEEIHVLCYFAEYRELADFCGMLTRRQSHIQNDERLLGEQIEMDEFDNVIGRCERWLGQAVQLTLEDVETETNERGGVMVPSHIDRPANSLLANLGFIPPSLWARTMEVMGDPALPSGCRAIRSSDAHSLAEILEGGFQLDVRHATAPGIVQALRA